MTRWQQLGFVRDSDDEDESHPAQSTTSDHRDDGLHTGSVDVFDSFTSAPATNSQNDRPPHQIEDPLDGDGLPPPPLPASSQAGRLPDLSENSSIGSPPLSSPPSSSLPDPDWLLNGMSTGAQPRVDVPTAIPQDGFSSTPESTQPHNVLDRPVRGGPSTSAHREDRALVAQTSQPLRNSPAGPGRQWRFRTRTALQLHPYLMERERFLQSIRGRGISPTDVARDLIASGSGSQEPALSTRENSGNSLARTRRNSQNSLSFSSSSSLLSSSHSLPPPSPHQSVELGSPASMLDYQPHPRSDGESVFSYLSDSPPRRLTRASSSAIAKSDVPLRSSDTDSLPDLDHFLAQPGPNSATRKRLRDVRIGKQSDGLRSASNPVSDGPVPMLKKPKVQKKFRVPAEFRKPRNPQARKRAYPIGGPTSLRSVRGDEYTRNPSPGSDTERPVRSDNLTAAHSDSSSDSSVVLTAVNKRDSRVLPPSWIRLGDPLNTATSSQSGDISLPTQVSNSPFPSTGLRGFQNRTELEAIGDPESSDIEAGVFQPVSHPAHFPHENISEDPMLIDDDYSSLNVPQSAPRRTAGPPTRTKKPKKCQTKLTDSFLKGGHLEGSQPTVPATASRAQRRRSSLQRLPRLGILDVDDSQINSSVTGEIPLFVRIAQRQARRSSTLGRSSPAGKIVRLQRASDTQEALAVLQQWKAGRLPRKAGLRRRPQALHPSVKARTRNDLQTFQSPTQTKLPRPHPTSASKQVSMKDVFGLGRDATPLGVSGGLPATRSKPNPTSISNTLTRRRQNAQSSGPLYRTGQLETVESFLPRHMNVFQQNLNAINSEFNSKLLKDPLMKSKVRGYLDDTRNEIGLEHPQASRTTKPAPPGPSRRKPKARRLEVTLREFRQPSDPPLPISPSDTPPWSVPPGLSQASILVGLRASWESYPVTFDVQPLEDGVFFQDSTLLGSTNFQKCLHIPNRDFSQESIPFVLSVGSQRSSLGPWDENSKNYVLHTLDAVSASFTSQNEIGTAPTALDLDHLASQLESVVIYLSQHIFFLDPADRVDFSVFILDSLVRLFDHAALFHTQVNLTFSHTLYRFSTSAICILHTASHLAPDGKIQSEIERQLHRFALLCVERAFKHDFSKLCEFLDQNRRSLVRESGLTNRNAMIQALVVIFHLSKEQRSTSWSIFSLFHEAASIPEQLSLVPDLERIWYKSLCLLPLLEFDSVGISRPSSRFSLSIDNWNTVGLLIKPVLDLYPATSAAAYKSVNSYLVAIIRRCHHLIVRWGWWKCADVLKLIFDFFAKRHFAHLQNEAIANLPCFLEAIPEGKPIELLLNDSAFTLFLKTLTVAIRGLSQKLPAKTVRNTVWRFIPLHSRSYSKDKDVLQEDIDALRNHHQLFCTLYCASPPGFRPKLSILKGLVDFSTSHINACLVNVCSWSVLLLAQLSFKEDTAILTEFSDHFSTIISSLARQYRLAHTEAEAQLQGAQAKQGTIPESLIRTVMRKNQTQILSCVSAAVAGLRRGLMSLSGKDEGAASVLMKSFSSATIYNLFDYRHSQVVDTIKEMFRAVRAYLDIVSQATTSSSASFENVNDSEESQDYGPWPTMEDIAALDELGVNIPGKCLSENSATTEVLRQLERDLFRLLSNYFGFDAIEDNFATEIIQVWALLASISVKRGLHDWAHYLDFHGSASVFHLQETDQTRPYQPLFFAEALRNDPTALSDTPNLLLRVWIASLMERESRLRYQHTLTAAILNSRFTHPVLDNLPFASVDGKFVITLAEMKERRLALIESILRNTRSASGLAPVASPQRGNTRQSSRPAQWVSFLPKVLMETMKDRYNEISGLGLASSPVVNQYVDFIHNVVQLLEQYSSSFCAVDRFFVEDRSFPRPTTDPDYQVGRLKSFSWTLSEENTQERLTGFLYACCARSILEGQEVNLARQLKAACSDIQSVDGSNLRALLFRHFHAFLLGWLDAQDHDLLLRSVLPALQFIVGDLSNFVNLTDPDSCRSTLLNIELLLAGFVSGADKFIQNHGYPTQSGWYEDRRELRIGSVTAGFKLLQSLVHSYGYLTDLLSPLGPSSKLSKKFVFLYRFAGSLVSTLRLQREKFGVNPDHDRDQDGQRIIERNLFLPQYPEWRDAIESVSTPFDSDGQNLYPRTPALHSLLQRDIHIAYDPNSGRMRISRTPGRPSLLTASSFFGKRELGHRLIVNESTSQEAITEMERFRMMCRQRWGSAIGPRLGLSVSHDGFGTCKRKSMELEETCRSLLRDPLAERECGEDQGGNLFLSFLS